MEYIPGPHLSNPEKVAADWEKAIFQKHSRSVTELPMQTYMNVIAKREYYGATLFAAKVCAGARACVCICRDVQV